MTRPITLTVNGRSVGLNVDADTWLLSVLRNELGLSGPRFGCGVGLCGACFVQLDGVAVPSCDTPMWSAEGKTVVTVEGLADNGSLHKVQQALLDEQAAQCAFCVSGVAVSAAALLEENPRPDTDEVARALDRNLCRCGAQQRMIKAVVKAGADS